MTMGVILLLFVAWQLWWTNISANKAQDQAVSSLAQEFHTTADPAPAQKNWDEKHPPATAAPAPGDAFGIVYIPRLGEGYQRPAAEGVSTEVLDTLGLGHYEHTAMPGEVGNFALAGHRQTNGAVLDRIDELQDGDHIYVQTKEGYYTYTVSESKIVLPTEVSVIAPNPQDPKKPATERMLTLTSCHPRYGDTERYIVHATFDNWRPLNAGAPDEIKNVVKS